MDFTKEQIKEKFDALPPELRKAIVYAEMEEIAESLKTTYGLHIDQLDRLATEITLILVGLVPTSEFQSRIMKNVGVAEDVANLITYDLNQELFIKIRQALRQGSNLNQKEPVTNHQPSPQKMFDQKMGGLSGLPKQTVEVSPEKSDNENDLTDPNPVVPRDPYREPV